MRNCRTRAALVDGAGHLYFHVTAPDGTDTVVAAPQLGLPPAPEVQTVEITAKRMTLAETVDSQLWDTGKDIATGAANLGYDLYQRSSWGAKSRDPGMPIPPARSGFFQQAEQIGLPGAIVVGGLNMSVFGPMQTIGGAAGAIGDTGYGLATGNNGQAARGIVQASLIAGSLATGPALSRVFGAEAATATESFGSYGGMGGVADAAERSYGVAFFGDTNLGYYTRDNATIGRDGKSFFLMPLQDAAMVKDAADAALYTGRAPSAESAYLNGGNVYGLSFPTDGMSVSLPTAADAGGWPHFLEGGNTAVRLGDGPTAGYLVNPTREFVIPGGSQVPNGSVLFQLGPNGEWQPMKRF